MSARAASTNAEQPVSHAETRRDFLIVAAGTFVAVGFAATLWPFIDSMNPTADTRATAQIEIDLKPIALGQRITVAWRGRPVFIEHRTAERIAAARADDNNTQLIDPALDSGRVQHPAWRIIVGVCTHLGCVPLGQREADPHGPFGGWFCPCHGSVFDVSGRVRRGPAPRNLEVPPYRFISPTRVMIG